MANAVHVVQTSSDERLLRECGASDAYRRQLDYAERLANYSSESRLTVFVLHPSTQVPLRETQHLCIEHIADPWPKNLIVLAERLCQLHQRFPVSVVSSQTVFDDAWACDRFCRRAGVPLVGQVHFDLFSRTARRAEFGRPPWNTIRWQLSKRLIRRMDAVRVVGTGLKREILQHGWNRNVSVIPVAIALNGKERPHAVETPQQPTLLYVGRLVAPKNVHTVLEVTRRIILEHPAIRLQIAGDGPHRQQLEQLAFHLGIRDNVDFLGAVDYDDLPSLYHSATVLMMPSEYEGFGRVSVEASLHQLPVVASRIRGLEDTIIDGQTGFLVPPHDLDAWHAAVRRLLVDPTLRHQIGRAARDYVRATFDPERLAQTWIELLVQTARTAA